MIVEVGDVQPVLRFDLATARPDIAVFKNVCDLIRLTFNQSPYRWAYSDDEVDPADGTLTLRLYHQANEPSIPEDVFRNPSVMVHCQNDHSRHGVDILVLVPTNRHTVSVRVGEMRVISIQVDADPVRQIALVAAFSDAEAVGWTTIELPAERRPSMKLLEDLRTGSTMKLQGLGSMPLRFNLDGGYPEIAKFVDLCITMPKFAPPVDARIKGKRLFPDRSGLSPLNGVADLGSVRGLIVTADPRTESSRLGVSARRLASRVGGRAAAEHRPDSDTDPPCNLQVTSKLRITPIRRAPSSVHAKS